MKTTIKLSGTGVVVYLDKEKNDRCLFEIPVILEGVKLDVIDGNEESTDITKKKGKYIKAKYFHDLVGNELGDEIVFGTRAFTGELEVSFDIEHEGEFNPKLLQLIKSDYEFQGLPYAVVVSPIKYDGKDVYCNEDFGAFKPWNDLESMKWSEGGQMYM